MSIRFNEKNCREMGRATRGVRGINLRSGDRVIDMEVVDNENTSVLVLTENGYGKRTTFSEWRVQNRGGKGVITIKTTQRNGKVVSAFTVVDTDEIVMVTESGQLTRTRAGEFREIGRNTQGVRASRLAEGDRLVCAARVLPEGMTDENGIQPELPGETANEPVEPETEESSSEENASETPGTDE
jgi:DNA gyrase subunit A